MKIELQSDYKKVVLRKIQEKGLRFSENQSEENRIIHYYSYLRKKAFEGSHQVFKSKEFSCPETVIKGFEKLEKIIKIGGDIMPYFNRTASDLTKYDDMFSDWGIMHFHLGEELIPGENLVKRGDPVLFAYMNDDKVYFLNIFSHGRWSDKEVIQLMYNNWPELLEKYIVQGVSAISSEPNSSDIKKLREAGITYFFSINDSEGEKVYLIPPGLGLNSARSSTSDSMVLNNIMNQLRHIQDNIIINEAELEKWMAEKGIKKNQEITLELFDFNPSELKLFDKYNEFTYTIQL
jgi:hypothetical protein